ncbi:MAG: rhomboid family intramembrane serine protease [Candidatus Krumholzibacteriia bacterium]
MFSRKRNGSVVCRSCGRLVDSDDERCYYCGARKPGLWGFGPLVRRVAADEFGLVRIIIGACAFLYVVALALDPGGIRMGGFLNLLAPGTRASFLLGAAGIVPVWEYGRWWTVLTAGWLHGSLLHVLFNMYWVYLLTPQVARIYGVGRTVIIYVAASVAGFVASSTAVVLLSYVSRDLAAAVGKVLGAAGFTLGASASLMGLLGALIAYSRRGGSSSVGGWAWRYVIFFLLFGLLVRSVDNWAHLGGLAGGYITALLLNPARPERTNHLIAAGACLAATVVALLASVITGLPQFL